MHSKLGKKLSDFVEKSPVNVSECQPVTKCSQMVKNGNLINTIARIPVWPQYQLNNKGVVTGAGLDNYDTQNDKYCLELQTTGEREKYVR